MLIHKPFDSAVAKVHCIVHVKACLLVRNLQALKCSVTLTFATIRAQTPTPYEKRHLGYVYTAGKSGPNPIFFSVCDTDVCLCGCVWTAKTH